MKQAFTNAPIHEKAFSSPALGQQIWQDYGIAYRAALDSPAHRPKGAGSAPEQILASKLAGRLANTDALSMMVSSMVRMVQAGKSSTSRWESS